MTIPRERLRSALGDRFEIERELGTGGMAVVYLAYDASEGREVALKVMLPELASSVGGERFLKEVQIGTRLSHTHILPLFGSGQEDGLLYYTMQYVEGETLRERLDREGQLPVEEALGIAREVASALDYAHRQGVVHRDIKPENIMLSEGGAVVMDFGIARALDEAGGDRLTKTGLSMGTPAYMSPEQADAADRLDGRADQYSLACVLYEMLAGHPPFTGPSAQAVLNRHARDPVPPLSSARPTVSLPVEAVIHKALSKVAADRFRTASKFSDALDMAEQGVTPRGVTPSAVTPGAVHATGAVGSLWAELKRRRVYTVGAAYAVVAFTLVQAAEATFPPLGVPEIWHTRLIWALLGGFPVALLLAWGYELTPKGVRRTQAVPLTPSTGTVLTPGHRWLMTAAVVVIAALGIWLTVVRPGGGGGESGGAPAIDLAAVRPNDLARGEFVVLPFRVSGGEEALGEGFVGLLDGALHGTGSGRDWTLARVTNLLAQRPDSGAALSREEGLRLAVEIGARRLVTDGSIVVTPGGVTVSASVARVPTGTVLAQETVEGSVDDLSLLANRLAALLMDEDWADAVTREELERVPAPALQAYLVAKQADLRNDRLRVREAGGQALDLYPEYPDAAYLLWDHGAAFGPIRGDTRGSGVGELLDRLSRRKRTSVEVRTNRYGVEEEPRRYRADQIALAERAYEENPGWPELARELSNRLYFWGAYVGRPDALEQSARLSRREYDLVEGDGQTLAAAWLARTAPFAPDTLGLRALADSVLAQGVEIHERYQIAATLDDRRTLDSLRAAGLHRIEPARFRNFAWIEGRPPDVLEDFEAAIDTARASAVTTRDQVRAEHFALRLALFRGQIVEARRLIDTLSRLPGDLVPTAADGPDPRWYLTLPIELALVREPGWDEASASAIDRLKALGTGAWYDEGDAVCYPELGNLLAGDTSTAVEAVQWMDAESRLILCPRMVEVLVERRETPDGPRPALMRLDSIIRLGVGGTLTYSANLVLARLFAESGDTTRALAAVRRRWLYRGNNQTTFLPSYLAFEGELALAAGDTTGARHAFEHYLRLRTDPDPPLQPQKARVEELLASLDGS